MTKRLVSLTRENGMTKLSFGRTRAEIAGSIIALTAVAYGFAALFGLVR